MYCAASPGGGAIGSVPAKYMLPSVPYGTSEGIASLSQARPAAQNPQTPLLPPNFQDPGSSAMQATQQSGTQPLINNLSRLYGGSPWSQGLFGHGRFNPL